MKSFEDSMQILRNYDLTGSYNGADDLSGCSPNTVKAKVGLRDAGRLGSAPDRSKRTSIIDPFRDKIDEWVRESGGDVLCRFPPHRPPGDGQGQAGPPPAEAAGVQALDTRARHGSPPDD